MSSPDDQQSGLDHVLDRDALRAEVLLQREAFGRRIADAEFELRLRLDAAIRQIAARLGARARGERRLEEFRRELDDVVQRLAPLLRAPRPRASTCGSGTPAIAASRSTASGKVTPSVSITKSKMLPFLPEEKSNHAAFWSFTKNEGVFSLLKGDRPFHSRPAFFSFTRRPTTSETGRRDFNSSRKSAEKRMGTIRGREPNSLAQYAGATCRLLKRLRAAARNRSAAAHVLRSRSASRLLGTQVDAMCARAAIAAD